MIERMTARWGRDRYYEKCGQNRKRGGNASCCSTMISTILSISLYDVDVCYPELVVQIPTLNLLQAFLHAGSTYIPERALEEVHMVCKYHYWQITITGTGTASSSNGTTGYSVGQNYQLVVKLYSSG